MTRRTHGTKEEDGSDEEDERRPMDQMQKERKELGRAKRDGKRADGQGGRVRRVGGPEKIRIYAERAKYSPPRLHSASDYGVALGEKHALPLAEGLIWRC